MLYRYALRRVCVYIAKYIIGDILHRPSREPSAAATRIATASAAAAITAAGIAAAANAWLIHAQEEAAEGESVFGTPNRYHACTRILG